MNPAQPLGSAETPGRLLADAGVSGREAAPMMGPSPASAAEVARAAIGDELEVAFQVTACHRGWLAGTVVERAADGTYRNTRAALDVTWPAGVPVFMGTAADITPAAVVQAQGRLTADGRLLPRRFAILTGYVEMR